MSIYKRFSFLAIAVTATIISLTSCNETKSYAERLTDETHSVNRYLCDFPVINEIPADTNFVTGPDAPFYRLDNEGNIYMQVIRKGDRSKYRATSDQLLMFRFTRWSLLYFYKYGEMPDGEGNSTNMEYATTSFRYNNTSLSSSTQWGSGIQMPLHYLGIDCEVNLIVKSQFGFTSEIAQVTPYLYNLRYFVPMSN